MKKTKLFFSLPLLLLLVVISTLSIGTVAWS